MLHTRHRFVSVSHTGLSPETFIGIFIAIAFIGTIIFNQIPVTATEIPSEAQNYAVKDDCIKDDVRCLIYKYSVKYGVDTKTALRIAKCESQYGKYPYNWEGSTAKGIYMFTDSTWEYTGGGDVLDPEQNIERFMQFYPQNKSWWLCQ